MPQIQKHISVMHTVAGSLRASQRQRQRQVRQGLPPSRSVAVHQKAPLNKKHVNLKRQQQRKRGKSDLAWIEVVHGSPMTKEELDLWMMRTVRKSSPMTSSNGSGVAIRTRGKDGENGSPLFIT
jgi:hypothetical protein